MKAESLYLLHCFSRDCNLKLTDTRWRYGEYSRRKIAPLNQSLVYPTCRLNSGSTWQSRSSVIYNPRLVMYRSTVPIGAHTSAGTSSILAPYQQRGFILAIVRSVLYKHSNLHCVSKCKLLWYKYKLYKSILGDGFQGNAVIGIIRFFYCELTKHMLSRTFPEVGLLHITRYG